MLGCGGSGEGWTFVESYEYNQMVSFDQMVPFDQMLKKAKKQNDTQKVSNT